MDIGIKTSRILSGFGKLAVVGLEQLLYLFAVKK